VATASLTIRNPENKDRKETKTAKAGVTGELSAGGPAADETDSQSLHDLSPGKITNFAISDLRSMFYAVTKGRDGGDSENLKGVHLYRPASLPAITHKV